MCEEVESVGTLQIGRLLTEGTGRKVAFSRTATGDLVEEGGDVPVPVDVYVTFPPAPVGREAGVVKSEGGGVAVLVRGNSRGDGANWDALWDLEIGAAAATFGVVVCPKTSSANAFVTRSLNVATAAVDGRLAATAAGPAAVPDGKVYVPPFLFWVRLSCAMENSSRDGKRLDSSSTAPARTS